MRPDSGDYLFAHALIQEGVYTSLLHSRKRELHARAAEWYGERELSLRAEHLDRAQDSRAPRAHLVAAKDEAHRFRYDTALRLAQRGSELAQEGELRHSLAMLRGELLLEVARTHESIAAFDEALQTAQDDEQRCHACLGIAAGRRVTGEFAEAMQALDRAQPIAERLELWSTCSRIHSTRGNLHFAQGHVSACGREHRFAFECAQRAGDVECEARALSGLADHCYAVGRMHSALAYFQRCVELSRKAGLMRVEIPNAVMVGHCLTWTGQGQAGLREVRHAVELSNRVGLAQTEVMALESMGFALVFHGAYEEAQPWIEKAIAAARQAGARRYLATNHMLMAVCLGKTGHVTQARALLVEAFELAQQIGMGFFGSSLLAGMARSAEAPAERKRLLQDGEAMLESSLAHARLFFYRDAIDAVLQDGNWDEALRYAEGLEQFVRDEPLAFAELVAARARALATLGQRGPEPAILAELTGLRERLTLAGFRGLVPEIDSALERSSRNSAAT